MTGVGPRVAVRLLALAVATLIPIAWLMLTLLNHRESNGQMSLAVGLAILFICVVVSWARFLPGYFGWRVLRRQRPNTFARLVRTRGRLPIALLNDAGPRQVDASTVTPRRAVGMTAEPSGIHFWTLDRNRNEVAHFPWTEVRFLPAGAHSYGVRSYSTFRIAIDNRPTLEVVLGDTSIFGLFPANRHDVEETTKIYSEIGRSRRD